MSNASPGKKIGAILTNLVQSSRLARPAGAEPDAALLPTTLGEPLIEQPDSSYHIDLSRLRLFSGLRSFTGHIAAQVLEQTRTTSSDLLLQIPIDSALTPELAALGASHLLLYVRASAARVLAPCAESLPAQLLALFGALRTPAWAELLFPKDPNQLPVALLFPFDASPAPSPYFLLIEHDPSAHFLRLTIELTADTRLNLKRIPHRIVKDIAQRHYRADMASMAEQLANGVHRECGNQRRELTEIPARLPPLFERLIEGGLPRLAGLTIRWPSKLAENLQTSEPPLQATLTRVLALLEDDTALRVLARGRLIAIADGDRRVYLDISRHGAALNISLDTPRPPPDTQRHLQRLPRLDARVRQTDPHALAGARILLIHHATTEVLGLIKALQKTGAEAITTLFVRYRGVIPPAYIEDMLSLPAESHAFHALQDNFGQHLKPSYHLSRQLSPIAHLEPLEAELRRRRPDYLEAMRMAALHLMLLELRQARRRHQRLLIIEDGGYLAPLLNQWCLEGRPFSAALDSGALAPSPDDPPPESSLRDDLAPLLPFTIEHTANGYYALRDVQQRHGALAIPALTIATSHYKNNAEAEACAFSLFEAAEHILSAGGRTSMNRKILILGNRGNIGRHLFRIAGQRASHGSAIGLDLCVPDGAPGEYAAFQQIPLESRRALDLILGVIGESVLPPAFLEDWLLHGQPDALYLASGSTKTSEFAQLSEWLETLAQTPNPVLGGQPVALETERIVDPQTGLAQGHSIAIRGLPDGREKTIHLLGDGMPLNFLYYGVPGEIIDGVFDELYHLLLTAHQAKTPYPALIHALDQNFHFPKC